jgi:hypothetical protein
MNTKLVASLALVTGKPMPANLALGERSHSGRPHKDSSPTATWSGAPRLVGTLHRASATRLLKRSPEGPSRTPRRPRSRCSGSSRE